MGPDAMILVFWMLSFKPEENRSMSSWPLIKQWFLRYGTKVQLTKGKLDKLDIIKSKNLSLKVHY